MSVQDLTLSRMFGSNSLRPAKTASVPWTNAPSLAAALVIAATGWAQQPAGNLAVRTSSATGLASFVTAKDGGVIPVRIPTGRQTPTPTDFLQQYGRLFGITDPGSQLAEAKRHTDSLGYTHTTYHQVHKGVPVFSGVLKVHQDGNGDVVAANGDFYPIPPNLSANIPGLTVEAAVAVAMADLNRGQPVVERSELVIVDPGWYGNRSIGPHLAYYIILTDVSFPLREAFFVNAHHIGPVGQGPILDRWSVLCTARWREVYDGQGLSAIPGVLARVEGDPPVESPEDVNRAYDYAGDIYDYYDRGFGRDGFDDAGATLMLTVNSTAPPCPNAYWDGVRMVFCAGTVTDDITAHEMTHGLTQHTAGLVYMNQSGQLNESFSDIFGELVDLFNGDTSFPGPPSGPPFWPAHGTGPGEDTPNNLRSTCSPATAYPDGVRWLCGEDADAFGGAIRDMWDPTCEGDPDYANSPLQTCNPMDNFGVHSGSGIPNHAFAILTDGKTFNGRTVTGIGPIKAAAIWYRALTVYLTPASDFRDAYFALNQAAADLTGTYPTDPRTGMPSDSAITTADTQQVDEALLAVEMDTEGACGATVPILDPTPPVECADRDRFFEDDFESGAPGWTTGGSEPPVGLGWMLTDQLPYPASGQAWHRADARNAGYDGGVYSLYSPLIDVPPAVDRPMLSFAHYFATYEFADGGNVKISVDGGPWTLIAPCSMTHNPYNTLIVISLNPSAGQPAFSGVGGEWGTTLVDLSSFISGGETIQLSFEFLETYLFGQAGWYVDDVELYTCRCTIDDDCEDGLFCNGVSICSGGYCQTYDPCPGAACQETTAECAPTVFFDDFENGNVQGWDLRGPDSTALSGDWVIGQLNGARLADKILLQPLAAFEGCGAAFTGEPLVLPPYGDVDLGAVYLVSPTINLEGASVAALSYVRWFAMDNGTYPLNGYFYADASSDNGQTWVNVETLGPDTFEGDWTPKAFRLETRIPFTDTVKIRFGARETDSRTWNMVEAAVDNVSVTLVNLCDVTEFSLDCNGNEIQDWCDIDDCDGDPACDDCNLNGVPDECDIAGSTSRDTDANDVPDECERWVIYVDTNAAGSNDGLSWDSAYIDLQDALAAVTALPHATDEIWVAAGTYTPSEPREPEDPRTATFQLVSTVALYGGFAGWETSRAQRDVAANETILSGDLNGDDGPDFTNNDENAYNVVVALDVDETATLDGFTITAGYANGPGYAAGYGRGAGLYASPGNPTIVNCTFRENFAGDDPGDGGGMCSMESHGPTTLVNCSFVNNTALLGGALLAYAADLNLVNCEFIGNTARLGAALRLSDPVTNVTIDNCLFSGNAAFQRMGGAIATFATGSLVVTNCTFAGNTSAELGGALYNGNDTNTILDNCIFWGNSDPNGTGETSQIYVHSGSVAINYSDVQGWTGLYGGLGNIGDDPQFEDADGADDIVGTEDDNLRLAPGSPCIDAGDNVAVPVDSVDLDADGDVAEQIPLDLEETPRFVDEPDVPDTGSPPGGAPFVDMGAYEHGEDCNGNGIADSYDLASGTSDDCNESGVPDECEPGHDQDCNDNLIPDPCDIYAMTSDDCNANAIPDECEASVGPPITQQPLDEHACEDDTVTFTVAAAGTGPLSYLWRRDGFDIPGADADTLVIDPVGMDDAGVYRVVVTDTCGSTTSTGAALILVSVPEPPLTEDPPVAKNRFVSLVQSVPGRQTVLRVTLTSLPDPFDTLNGTRLFVGQPRQVCENAGQGTNVDPQDPDACGPAPGQPQDWFWAAPVQCEPGSAHFMDWATLADYCNGGINNAHPCIDGGDCPEGTCGVDGILHIYHEAIIPSHMASSTGPIDVPAIYDIQMIDARCELDNESGYSEPLPMTQAGWGDVVLNMQGCPNDPPEESISVVTDVVAILNKFSNTECAPRKTRVDLEPHNVDLRISISEVVQCLSAFTGGDYPFGWGQCGHDGLCNGGLDHGSLCTTDDDCSSDPCP